MSRDPKTVRVFINEGRPIRASAPARPAPAAQRASRVTLNGDTAIRAASAAARDRCIEDAIGEGRFDESRRSVWAEAWDRDPSSTRRLLAASASNGGLPTRRRDEPASTGWFPHLAGDASQDRWQRRNALADSWVEQGRIAASERAHYRDLLDIDEDRTVALAATVAPARTGAIPASTGWFPHLDAMEDR